MESITEPYVESETPQEEEVVETKVKTNDGRGKNPNSMANLKPRAKKSPDAPKVRYAVKPPVGDTMIYDMAAPKKSAPPPETPKKKKRRTKVVVVEQDSSDEDSDQDIQVVVAKKQKKKPTPPVPSAPKRPATPAPMPREESDDELEVKPVLKAPPRPVINFF